MSLEGHDLFLLEPSLDPFWAVIIDQDDDEDGINELVKMNAVSLNEHVRIWIRRHGRTGHETEEAQSVGHFKTASAACPQCIECA